MENASDGAGRWVSVPPERIVRWADGFAQRHGAVAAQRHGDVITLRAADGAAAQCHVPFPPLRPPASLDRAAAAAAPSAADCAELMAAHAARPRMVGVLLVRLGGYAAGVFDGYPPKLTAAKTGSRPVHGRSAAGGWSQQRFARRREKQAAGALAAAADAAAVVLSPLAGALDAVVTGGDRQAIRGLQADPRLRPIFGLACERFLTVPDPRLAVLRDTPRMFLAIRIRLTEPAEQA